MIFRFVLLFCVTSLQVNALSTEKSDPFPPDTATNFIDKSAALMLLEEGKRMFSEGKTKDALTKFRQTALKDPNSWKPVYWIGICHYTLSNYGFALKYGYQAIKLGSNDIDKEVYDLLGKSYHELGELDSAINNFQKAQEFLSSNRIKDLEIVSKIEQCRLAKDMLANAPVSKRKHLEGEVNSGYNDYGPVVSSDGQTMYFTSRRNNTKGGKSNPDDQEYFEDVYRATWNESIQKWDSVTNEVDRINSHGFDAFSYLSEDQLFGLMTVNTSSINKKTKGSDIFEIVYSNKGKWSSPKRIENKTINSTFFDGSPTLTADGNTMYFVSDRNGNKKFTDIYVVHKVGKDWGEAVPISDTVNSKGRETTPFITPDGRYLFFSSDGHPGMGGFDVFVSENLGDNWSKPVNLGAGINTVNNDTHFKYVAALKKAYVAGFEIIGQKSSMDIYEVDMSDFIFPGEAK